jgi:hypothetical protein
MPLLQPYNAHMIAMAAATLSCGRHSNTLKNAKCGFACHTVVKNRDYVFTEYGKR